MSFPYLFRKGIADDLAQENFRRIGDFHAEDPFARGSFQFLVIPIASAVTNFKFPHGLKFAPMDVIITHNLSNATIVLNYDKFDAINLDITSSAATTLRLFVGRYI